MNLRLKKQWQVLKRGKPGHRFVARYETAQRKENRASFVTRVIRFVVAAISIALGVVFAVIPGPAILFFALAGALLASESRIVARFLDWSEVKIRLVVRFALRIWRRLPLVGKIGVVTIGVACSAIATYFSYRFFGG